MTWTITTAPLLPLIFVIAIATLGAVLTVYALLRGARGSLTRGLGLAALIALILNPSLVEEDRDPISDVVVIAIDRSQSQTIGAREEITERARAEIETHLRSFDDIEIRIVEVATDRNDGGRGGTRAFGDLARTLGEVAPERLAGVLFLTDGQIHDVPDPSRFGFDAPIHVLLTGHDEEGDRILTVEQAPVFGIVGDDVELSVRVEDHGPDDLTGTAVQLRVRVDGEERAPQTATVGELLELSVPIAHGGQNIIELEVSEGPRELTLANNRAVVTPNGVRDRLRVLLITGEPHPGERTWRDLLKSDPSVDLVHFTILRPPEKQDGTPIDELSLIAFPTRELFAERLYEFDLVIFDRYRRRSVLHPSYLANIADYVEQGGALLTAAGPSFANYLSLYRTPLAGILPARPTGDISERPYQATVTERGARHPVTASLPGANEGDTPPQWGRWFRLIESEPVSGDTVMSSPDGMPVLVLDRVGDGRVAQLLSDHAWLWTRGFEGGGPQAELLRRLAHWLMREPELDEEVLSAEVFGEDMRITRRTMSNEAASVYITDPSGNDVEAEMVQIEPGLFSAVVPAPELGLYRLTDGVLTTVAASGVLNALEFQDVRVSSAPTEALRTATGGGIYWLAGRNQNFELPSLRRTRTGRPTAGRSWLGLRENNQYSVRAVREVSLIPAVLALLLIVGLLAFAWWREGH